MLAGSGSARLQGQSGGLGAALAQSRNLIRADRLLQSGEVASGEFEVLAELALGDNVSESAVSALAVRVFTAEPPPAGTRWVITLLAPTVDLEPLIHHGLAEWRPAAAAAGRTGTTATNGATDTGGTGASAATPTLRGWVYFAQVAVPEDFQDAAVAVENLTTGSWGAALVEFTDEIATSRSGLAILTAVGPVPASPVRLPLPTPYQPAEPAGHAEPAEPVRTIPTSAPIAASAPAVGAARAAGARAAPAPVGEIIKLIPPARRPVVGRVRFRTVVTMDGIRSTVFYLDGERVAEDRRSPFSAMLDLGPTPRARVIRVEAFGYQDLKLGEDEITINLDQQPFAVRIGDLESDGSGKTRVTARISVPPAEQLARVEFYKNQELVATLSEPPFEATFEGSRDPSDFLRVVAYLVNGDSLEDARLFSDQVMSERIEVNLVEVYAVVSDRDGNPVQDLSRDRFRLTQGRREIPIERFALADEVPLVLGLIIDSSQSMDFLMDDTKRAAARFLSQTVLENDRAFLVDFDTQPRLAQGLSGDLGVLLPALGRLQVGGNTALYDAVVYSLTQFEREPGRRALVLLTDGRDYGSKFGPKRALAEARRLGVPVYVIAISDLANRMPGAWMQKQPKKGFPVDAFLESFSKGTGGRVFSIIDMNELETVYEVINVELRNQYLLAFSTSEPLSQKELESLEVSVTGRGLSTRIVVLER